MAVGENPAVVGDTGYSIVYDRDATDPAAVSNGQIAFTPPEAVSPGIKVQPEVYTQGGPDGITLSGCPMTSNPGATCTSEFQSGKRIKQQMTGLGPLDLVFDVTGGEDTAFYQVFHRLINVTGEALKGFKVELGYGIGDAFQTVTEGLKFAAGFRAQPTGSGPVSSQFPFGLFGDATTNPNFTLDGFFAADRTGLNVTFADNLLASSGFYGPYDTLFAGWLSQDDVPLGGFWDNDADPLTDALLMVWFNPATQMWEVRRQVSASDPTQAETIAPVSFATLAEAEAYLNLTLLRGAIEDLANLNLNFGIEVGDYAYSSFTLRTTVLPADLVAAVPLPAAAPLLAAGLGLLAMLRRRRRHLA